MRTSAQWQYPIKNKEVNDLKRKLFALLMSSFAIVLLMGAGVEDTPAEVDEVASSIRTEEPSAPVEEPVDDLTQTDMVEPEPEADGLSPAPEGEEDGSADPAGEDPAEEPAEEPETTGDETLLIDGQPAPVQASKTIVDGVTYVSLKVVSQILEPACAVAWDEASACVTVTAPGLTLTAGAGDLYLQANGRYLYLPDGVQVVEGQTMVPLNALAEVFGATVGWDAATATVTVTTGGYVLESGESYYNEEDLFWLSRLIYAESGNQPLEGKMAVGNVVLNRVENGLFPDTILGVISQRNQFSTYRSGALAERTPNEESVLAAKLVLDGGVVEEVEEALYFDSSSNSWASRNRNCIAVIGGHKFYD